MIVVRWEMTGRVNFRVSITRPVSVGKKTYPDCYCHPQKEPFDSVSCCLHGGWNFFSSTGQLLF